MRRAADIPLAYNAVDVVERNLVARADKVALCSAARELTFRQVSEEINRVGNALCKLDVRIGDPVAILCLDCAEWATSFYGIVKAGGVAVGLNTMLTPREYAYILQDCRARVLIVHESLLPAIEEIRDGLPFLEHVIVVGGVAGPSAVGFEEWIGGESTKLEAASTHHDDFCMLNYSSGTTGKPKGILHAHKDLPLSAQLDGVDAVGITESDRNCTVAKLFFTYGSGANLMYAWYAGATICLFPEPSRSPANVLQAIDRFRATVFHGVPTSYASMLAVEGFTEAYDLSSVRLCISAGEALPPAIWHEWKRHTRLEILEGIGTTEFIALFLRNPPGDVRPGSSGKPVPGFDVRIIDDEGRPVPTGVIGNLAVRGETAALSYLHQYEKSRSTFRGEWTLTGDTYHVDENGFYWCVGRADEMLKVGGVWVSPIEIENTLAAHEAVLESAVIGWPDGSGLIKPKAFVVLRLGREPSDELARALIDYCAAEMAPYKRPRWVEFVAELPRTASGKLQRSKLREHVVEVSA